MPIVTVVPERVVFVWAQSRNDREQQKKKDNRIVFCLPNIESFSVQTFSAFDETILVLHFVPLDSRPSYSFVYLTMDLIENMQRSTIDVRLYLLESLAHSNFIHGRTVEFSYKRDKIAYSA